MTTTTTRSSRRRKVKRAEVADLSPEVVWYLESRGYKLDPDRGPLIRTPEPSDVKGAVFDPLRVDRVIKALRALPHTKGKWAKPPRPLDPSPWQVAYVIAPVFGWVAPDDDGVLHRIVREAYIEVPRKNGKTTLVAGLGMYLAFGDDEAGAEVYMAAGSREQAGFGFAPLVQIAEKSKVLRKAGVRPLKRVIQQESTGSYIKPVSSRGDLSHGANVHGGLVDELHVHKSPDTLEAIETGTGSRDQPLVIIITTADDGQTETAYAARRDQIEKLANGVLVNPTRYGVVFALPDDSTQAERLSLTGFARANPSYPITPTRAFAESKIAGARSSPTELASYERLHAGIRSKRDRRFIQLDRWDRNKGHRVDLAQYAGRRAFGGFDLGAVSDLTAWALLFPRDGGGFDVAMRFWTPEESLDALDARTQGNATKKWLRYGWLATTPGDVTDYDFIRAAIVADCEQLDVEAIGFDRWNSTQIVTDLIEDGLPLVKISQTTVGLNAATKELERLVLRGKARDPKLMHGGNPVLRWMVDNLRTHMDSSGNIKPDKGASMDKIDGPSAIVNGLAVAITAEPEQQSTYTEDRGLLVV